MGGIIEFAETIFRHTSAFWLAVEGALVLIFAGDLVAIGLEMRRVRTVPNRKSRPALRSEWRANANDMKTVAYSPLARLRRIGERAGIHVGDVGGRREWRFPNGYRGVWAGLVLLALVLLALWPLLGGDRPKHALSGRAQPVGVARAEVGDLNVTLTALGTVTPLASVTIRPQVNGEIVKIDFDEGQMVKAGDTLAEIDARPYQAALDQAKGQLARDRASLTNAETDLGRFQSLWNQKAVSQQQLANQSALVKQDKGILVSDAANVRAAEINLGYTKIISPITGRVGLRQLDIGNLVQAGQANGIAVVTQLEPISVLFTVPEDDVDEVVRHLRGGARLPADVYDRDQVRKLASGKLSAVDTQVDTATGTVKLRATFDNADETLFPNQFVNVQLLVSTLHGQIVVPRAAMQSGAEGSFVYVLNKDSTVRIRPVTPGLAEGERVAITSGLKGDEVVVVDGADRLRDGMAVTPLKTRSEVGGARSLPTLKDLLRAKLTLVERRQFQAMSHDERKAWLKAHRDELLKRTDQPRVSEPD